MDTGKETPITKYLANLERRQSTMFLPSSASPLDLTPSPSSPPKTIRTRGPQGIQMRLRFDDTFFGDHLADESILHISPQPGTKRRRTSFFDGETSQSQRLEELEQHNSELERLLRQTQAELIDSRASYSKLDQLNIDMRRSHAEKIINLERAQEEMKIKAKNATDRADSMDKLLQKYQKKETELKTEFNAAKSSLNSKQSNLEERISELQKENFQLNQKITNDAIEAELAARKLQAEFDENERGAEKWIMDCQIMKEQLVNAQNQLQTSQTELKKAQIDAIKYLEVKNKYENALSANEAATTDTLLLQERVQKFENLYLKEQLQAQNILKAMNKVQEENNILRSTIKSEMILQEQVTSLESEIAYMQKELKEKGAVEAERNVLRNEVKAWKAVAFQVEPTCATPINFETVLRRNQDLLLSLKHENTNLKYSSESSARQVTALQAETSLLREQLKVSKEEKEKLTFDSKKMSRRMILLVKDRDGLKELKESYEKEFDGLISEPLKQRIDELEKLVGDYEALLNDENNRKPCKDCEERNSLVDTLKSELETTKLEKEKLSQTLAEHQTFIEDPTTGVKIVSFGNNPSFLTIEARLKECLLENENLKEKLKAYEENTLVGMPSDAVVLEEKRKLEEQLRTLERKHQILTEAYDNETVQLQNACSKLFGYHVTLIPGGSETPPQIRIQSTYSTIVNDVFVFQDIPDSGDMMLIDTPILNHFRDEIEVYLNQACSIPGFLASVTITYVQGQTQTQSSQSSQPSQPEPEEPPVAIPLSNEEPEDTGVPLIEGHSLAARRPGPRFRGQPESSRTRYADAEVEDVEEEEDEEIVDDEEEIVDDEEEEDMAEDEEEYDDGDEQPGSEEGEDEEDDEGDTDIYAGLDDAHEDDDADGDGGDDDDDDDVVMID